MLTRVKKTYTPIVLILLYLLIPICGCVERTYLISNAFDKLGIKPENNNLCTAIISLEKISYILCEPEKRAYKIKIILSDPNNAVLIIFPEYNVNGNPLESIIERDIGKISISISYLIDSDDLVDDIKRGKKVRLKIKSLPMEQYTIDALFFVDRFLIERVTGRDKLR
ncbi:MAG: hypothetical protein N2746_11820 [Deltaproteobacteria bacterium]|nr:hypothetical protein [Deltaproteobacteria bacterium]